MKVVATVLCLAAMAGVGWIVSGGLGREAHVVTAGVPSYWEQIPLTCETSRIEAGSRTLEWFTCRHEPGTGRPAPGRYDERDTSWYSDVDRRRARIHDIVVARSGVVRGWAGY
jgi:hypothetical protein